MSAKLGLSLKEEHRLRVFNMRMLRRICGPRREGGGNRTRDKSTD
jgi:hypothetical protein